MIFYYSGTGNSRWVAQQLAELTGDQALDLIPTKQLPLQKMETVGLVFPIYAWGVPDPVLDFVKRLPKAENFSYAVATCGSEAGLALKKLSQEYPLSSSYSLVMPNNYILGADVDSEGEARQKIQDAEKALHQMAREIKEKKPVYQVKEGKLAALKSGIINYGFNHYARSTKGFYVTDACIGCGECARNCPAGTINMVRGKPSWGKECYQCLRCINACPQKAIQYGKSTQKRGRYTIDLYLNKKQDYPPKV